MKNIDIMELYIKAYLIILKKNLIISIVKHKIINLIRKSSVPLGIEPKRIFNEIDEIPDESRYYTTV
ncbi:hypothetical protein U3516DRAFT_763155 [Neocallimastix sp. 'constans']